MGLLVSDGSGKPLHYHPRVALDGSERGADFVRNVLQKIALELVGFSEVRMGSFEGFKGAFSPGNISDQGQSN